MGIINKLFGTVSEREVKKLSKTVDIIESYDAAFRNLSDDELKMKTEEFRGRLKAGETLDDILPEAFATVREASRRVTGMFPYRVQLIGGIIIHQGRIAEMRTGEGKTLVAVLPSYLNALTGESVHVITVNDYLASRDATEMGRIHKFLGLSVGCLTHDTPLGERKSIYNNDIIYGTNSEFGFDYLRDNMATHSSQIVQSRLNFAIIDEVDSILIDEARTPLIISGASDKSSDMYVKADRLACRMQGTKVAELDNREITDDMEGDYIIDEKHHSVVITAAGYKKIEAHFKIENSADPENAEIIHHVTQAIRAHGQMEIDKDYLIEDGEIVIIDEFTGRLMYGRRYNNGLHQAIEAKEGLEIKKENITLATITLQNYFRMYNKVSGMTGTAMTEAEELGAIYKLDVVEIPTNRPMIRVDHNDKIYINMAAKYNAIIKQIIACRSKNQPVLVGTTSVEKSEYLSSLLKKQGIPHKVLNAKNHKREAEIVAQAGEPGAVTIATNMAGRGTDIILGGNFKLKLEMRARNVDVDKFFSKKNKLMEEALEELKSMSIESILKYGGPNPLINEAARYYKDNYSKVEAEWREKNRQVVEVGGLFILGTERHESRRIDNQLRGRAGRQGDPGESCFMLSLEDDLLRVFGGEKVQSIMKMGGQTTSTEPLQMSMLSSTIERAQKGIESIHYQARKNVIKFDDVINKQRDIIYKQRRDVLTGKDMHDQILGMIDDYVVENIDQDDLMASIEGNPLLKTIFEDDIFAQFNQNENSESVIDDFQKAIKAYYAEKIKDMPDGMYLELERGILLANVDKHWREHIDAMAELQKGIGLRGYGQKDPVVEYTNEGFDMFNEMTAAIRAATVEQLILINFKFEPLRG